MLKLLISILVGRVDMLLLVVKGRKIRDSTVKFEEIGV